MATSRLASRYARSLDRGLLLSMGGLAVAAMASGLAPASEVRAEGSAVVVRQRPAALPTLPRKRPEWTWTPGAAAPSPTGLPRPAPAPTPTLPRCRDVRQLYRVDRVIGRGGFGLVHCGRERASDCPVAIKRLSKDTTSKDKFLQEVEILRAMDSHDNVVQLHEAFETSDAYILVTELVNGVELFERLVTHGAFDEDQARTLVQQLARTLAYLHDHSVVHGDIKPENILLASDDESMRLIDFGQSFREHDVLERLRSVGSGVATVAYAAPEVLQQCVEAPEKAGSAIDMWGLGVVLYILLCGCHPFDAENNASDDELRDRIVRGVFDQSSDEWHDASPEAHDLICGLLQVDPAKRLTADQVLSHRWVDRTLRRDKE